MEDAFPSKRSVRKEATSIFRSNAQAVFNFSYQSRFLNKKECFLSSVFLIFSTIILKKLSSPYAQQANLFLKYLCKITAMIKVTSSNDNLHQLQMVFWWFYSTSTVYRDIFKTPKIVTLDVTLKPAHKVQALLCQTSRV